MAASALLRHAGPTDQMVHHRGPDPVRPDVAIRPRRESPRSTARRGPSSSRPRSASTGARDRSPREEQTRTLPEQTTPALQTRMFVARPRTQRWIRGPSSQAARVRRRGDDVRVHLCRTTHRVSSRAESCPNRRVPSGSRTVWQADCSRTIERGSSLLGSGVQRLPLRRQSHGTGRPASAPPTVLRLNAQRLEPKVGAPRARGTAGRVR